MVQKFGDSKQHNNAYYIEKKYEKFECENLCMKFYKYILGVHSKSTNIAVLGDLGRSPLNIDIICSIMKYFQRLQGLNENHL